MENPDWETWCKMINFGLILKQTLHFSVRSVQICKVSMLCLGWGLICTFLELNLRLSWFGMSLLFCSFVFLFRNYDLSVWSWFLLTEGRAPCVSTGIWSSSSRRWCACPPLASTSCLLQHLAKLWDLSVHCLYARPVIDIQLTLDILIRDSLMHTCMCWHIVYKSRSRSYYILVFSLFEEIHHCIDKKV